MNHQGTKTQRGPIPEDLDRVASVVVDAAFDVLINFNVPLIRDGIKRIAL
jgi:hypothetical protein